MSRFGHVFLSWRKGVGHHRHLVGRIKRSASEGVVFEYIEENLEAAKQDGFSPYTEFPDVQKKYTKNVLETFAQRITKSERTDIAPFYAFWKIEPEKLDDPLYMLAMTQGWVPTDNFEFLADFQPTVDLFFVTDIAGLSDLKLPVGIVSIGDTLTYKRDIGNEHDRSATRIYKGDTYIGFVKKVHNRVFCQTKRPLELRIEAIDQNGAIRRIFVSVRTSRNLS